jgi:cyclophilin family peptidyl-prolyl cis-trans isomerase
MLSALLAVACTPQDTAQEETQEPSAAPRVVLETTMGRIVMELDPEHAPNTVRNFLAHVRAGFYDNLTFHRVRPGFMIQAGYYTPEMARARSSADPIMNESEHTAPNLRGTVAMARMDYEHSIHTQFFINLVDNPGLDYDSTRTGNVWGYPVFGSVIEGMDVVDAIAAVPTERRGQNEAVPLEPIVITRAFLMEEPA